MKNPILYFRLLKAFTNGYISRNSNDSYITLETYQRLVDKYHYDDDEITPPLLRYLIKHEIPNMKKTFLGEDCIYHSIYPIAKDGEIDYGHTIDITRRRLLEAAKKYYEEGYLSKKELDKLDYLQRACSYETFLKLHQNEEYIYTNPFRKNHSIKIIEMIKFLELPQEELEQVLEENPLNLSKREFVHLIKTFFQKEQTTEKYFFPEEMLEKINYLTEKVDTAALECHLDDRPFYYPYIQVNEELWDDILSKIPEDFNNLEKAYYIYYQLCKTFTYNEDYFVLGETKKETGISIDRKIYNLKKLNKKNNQVVCYEILAIFEKFMNHLNIPYDMTNTLGGSGHSISYESHKRMSLIIDEFLLEADATRGVISGDMPLAKENRSLEGFICLNYNEETQEKFNASLKKVHDYIKETEKQETSFFDIVDSYQSLIEEDQSFEITVADKLSILVNSISQTELSETDRLVYISELTKILFPDGICQNYFVLEYLDGERLPVVTTIFEYKKSPTSPSKDSQYFAYSTKKGLEFKSHEEIQESFEKEKYEYMLRYRKELPDIKVEEKSGGHYAR